VLTPREGNDRTYATVGRLLARAADRQAILSLGDHNQKNATPLCGSVWSTVRIA
jgi:hypothetical protein